jgi:pimeloyl-ACP methyl ester carboxylesterase
MGTPPSFLASLVRDVMLALHFEGGTVVWQSLDSRIAMQFGHQHPSRCERLVPLGPGGLGRVARRLGDERQTGQTSTRP